MSANLMPICLYRKVAWGYVLPRTTRGLCTILLLSRYKVFYHTGGFTPIGRVSMNVKLEVDTVY